VGEITFHLPEAKTNVAENPLVYFIHTDKAENQFHFWPSYDDRKGQNAIFMSETGDLFGTNAPRIPPELKLEFESVTNARWVTSTNQGRPVHRLALIECRALR